MASATGRICMDNTATSTQLAVIGGGPGGYAAAFLAADLGMAVTLIDEQPNPGGTCLYRGCIPSKTLLHAAKVLRDSRQAAEWGIHFSEPKIDLSQLRSWKTSVVEKLTEGLGQLSRQRSVQYIQGRASFVNPSVLQVDERKGGSRKLEFQHAIIATGSRPSQPPGEALQSTHVLDSTSALELPSIPSTMLVVGGGYIGLELGSVYAALGTRVSLVEMTSGLLPGADRDLVSVLSKRLEKEFASIRLNTKLLDVRQEADALKVRFEGARPDSPQEESFETILVCTGRQPNSRIAGLEKTKVEIDGQGFIQVDAKRQTKERTIYAIGDVAGEPMLAHKAFHEGRTAAEAIAGRNVYFEPAAIPAVVFTDPEIAWCGLTETQAREQNLPVAIARFPWAASGRAATLSRPEGITKLVIDRGTERILGVGIAGSGAGELIAEGVLAVEMAARASDLALSIHPHPTLSETLQGAAEVFFGQSTHVYNSKKKPLGPPAKKHGA